MTLSLITIVRRHTIRLLLFAALGAGLLGVSSTATAQQSVAWDTLAEVDYEQVDQQWILNFSDDVKALDGSTVKIEGFIMPIEVGGGQREFLLTKNPSQGCFFCSNEGPESMIEVQAGHDTEFTYDAVAVQGTLHVLEDNDMGLYYRITDAQVQE